MMAESIAYDPHRMLTLKDSLTALDIALETIRPRHRAVLEARYGIEGIGPLQYKEIAKTFGFSVERGRQIEAKALRDLKLKVGKFLLEHCEMLMEK